MPWARASTHQGRRITPKKQREHRDRVQEVARGIWTQPMEGPVKVNVTFVYKQPKRVTVGMVSRPDIDNLCKQVLDALNGIAWIDDAQVVELTARKLYGDTEQTVVDAATITPGAFIGSSISGTDDPLA